MLQFGEAHRQRPKYAAARGSWAGGKGGCRGCAYVRADRETTGPKPEDGQVSPLHRIPPHRPPSSRPWACRPIIDPSETMHSRHRRVFQICRSALSILPHRLPTDLFATLVARPLLLTGFLFQDGRRFLSPRRVFDFLSLPVCIRFLFVSFLRHLPSSGHSGASLWCLRLCPSPPPPTLFDIRAPLP
jgi:hypothetical protein